MSLNIAIIGAGIGGLATAALASDAGHRVTLIERFERPHPVGSGLVIQPVGLAVLARMTVARYTHGTLARPFAARLAFIGDAAHRASPQLGQGANMALLDALALVTALAAGPEDALPAYAAMRRWHIRAYQAASAVLTPMYQSDSRLLPLLRDRLLAPLGELPGIRGLLTALVSGDLIPPLAGQRLP